jgi:hypothetical protein
VTEQSSHGGTELLSRQLWAAAVDAGEARVVVTPIVRRARSETPEWLDEECYWALPTTSALRLLVPAASRRVTAAALSHYRQLRPPRERRARLALSLAAGAGLPAGAHRVRLQVRAGAAVSARAHLPLTVITEALAVPRLYASSGVRPGPNGKPTLHLLDPDGRARGYAKLGWNPHTDDLVATEGAVLKELAGGGGLMRVPRLLAEGSLVTHRWIVTEPLPSGAKGLRGRGMAPSPAELSALCPVVRRSRPTHTDQWAGVTDRLAKLADSVPEEMSGPLARVTAMVSDSTVTLPVAERWHGDLTPWNCARDVDGQLWCWDWESSETDAVAGLDALHWAMSVRRERAGGPEGVLLADCLGDALPYLRAVGLSSDAGRLVAAVYVVTVAERAVGLAARAGWKHAWISPRQLAELLMQALTSGQSGQSS